MSSVQSEFWIGALYDALVSIPNYDGNLKFWIAFLEIQNVYHPHIRGPLL